MLYLRYIAAEMRRRRGRTILTALGLGVGVGLVVTVTALSSGLDRAQSEVLDPLTGVGTDMTVKRPIEVGEGGGISAGGPALLSPAERRRLEREGAGPPSIDFDELGDPGERFSTDNFVTTDLSFPASAAREIRATEGVAAVAAALTLDLVRLEGRIPDSSSEQPDAVFGASAPAPGGGAVRGEIGFQPTSVAGIDARNRDLGLVRANQVADGRFLRPDERDAAMVTTTYADENSLEVGDDVEVGGHKLEIVGTAKAPLGGEASDIYMQLERLQQLSDRKGRVNTLEVRADSVDSVDAVAARIEQEFGGSEATTAKDLAERVSGSLVHAKNLSEKLGTALGVVALLAAVLIASLLTLSSVNKRTRELGTLKAIGWRRWMVVRQISGESIAQGLIGAVFGAAIGVLGAYVIDALDISLKASTDQTAGVFGPRQRIVEGTSEVTLGAPVDASLLLLAIGLALLGGLVAGIAGGIRAGRLAPAEALRSVE
jgi:putative ABC transport system permease protein